MSSGLQTTRHKTLLSAILARGAVPRFLWILISRRSLEQSRAPALLFSEARAESDTIYEIRSLELLHLRTLQTPSRPPHAQRASVAPHGNRGLEHSTRLQPSKSSTSIVLIVLVVEFTQQTFSLPDALSSPQSPYVSSSKSFGPTSQRARSS